ncbi:ABC transporter substrate-binding protein [Gordonia shandongensis]|uniref:ABC transporter substrate-binding protein n=1 Tax=Gordonia shandongensis TaxID=376351 RepID=UPI0004073358|nr:helical backbone metal receptor [Gordonia shandongensis]
MRLRSTALALLLGLTLVGGTVACGSDASDPSASAVSADPSDTPGTAEYRAKRDKALAQFPDAPADTVVSASIPMAEILALLDVPVAGVPSSTTQKLPAALDSVPRIGTHMALDVEKIVSLSPDLVVAAEGARSMVESSLRATSTPAAFLTTDSIGDLRFAADVLATAFDREEKGRAVLADIDTQIDKLASARGSADAPRVLALIGASDSFMVMNGDSFLGSLLRRAGAENIADTRLRTAETYSAVNMEDIIAAQPDVILVLQSGDVAEAQSAFDEEVERNAAWKSLPAYTDERIHVLDYNDFGYTTVSTLPTAVPTLTGYLYP